MVLFSLMHHDCIVESCSNDAIAFVLDLSCWCVVVLLLVASGWSCYWAVILVFVGFTSVYSCRLLCGCVVVLLCFL